MRMVIRCIAPALTKIPFFWWQSFSSLRRVNTLTTINSSRALVSPSPCLHLSTTQQVSVPKVSSSSASAASSSPCRDVSEVEEQELQEEVEDQDQDEDEDGDEGFGSSHTPVLLSEVRAAFRDVHLHTFVDCTLGAAGHASSIIRDHSELRTFVGLDVDLTAHSEAAPKLQDAIEHRNINFSSPSDLKLHVLEANFRNVKSALHGLGLADRGVDGILMDLGMSSMQLNVAERGFSLQRDGPLDMRMDPSATLTAGDILNNWPETEIGRIIREYGEERQWKRLARKISEAQLLGGIHSTSNLLQLIQKSLPSKFSPGRAGWKKTAVRVFQALRIAVNDELSALEVALPDAFECLSSKGRLAVITFHSLEDRIVKRFFLKAMGEVVDRKARTDKCAIWNDQKDTKLEGERRTRGNKMLEGRHALVLTKRPMIAGIDEIKQNSRARSAKLRILEKK